MTFANLIIEVEHTGATFPVQFNPEEYTINQDNNFAAQTIPGLSAPQIQFVSGNMRTLDMEIFLDTYDSPSATKSDVRSLTGQILSLMDIDPELHAPPVLIVRWSSLQFRCLLAKVVQKYILFSDDGTPVRARLNCTFNEYVDLEREIKQIGRQTADFSKAHVVTVGETLSGIAGVYYGDATHWRPIAIENGIDDPRSITPGQSLAVPALPYTDPETGMVI